jgi:fumarate reductase subunit D
LEKESQETKGSRPPVLFFVFGFAFVIFSFLTPSTVLALGIYVWLGLSQAADLARMTALLCAAATLIGFIGMVLVMFGKLLPAICDPLFRRTFGFILGMPSLATNLGLRLPWSHRAAW